MMLTAISHGYPEYRMQYQERWLRLSEVKWLLHNHASPLVSQRAGTGHEAVSSWVCIRNHRRFAQVCTGAGPGPEAVSSWVCIRIHCRFAHEQMCVCSVVSDSLWPHGLQPTRLFCPWNFPGKNTGVVVISFSRGSSQPRDWTHVSWASCIGQGLLHYMGSNWLYTHL